MTHRPALGPAWELRLRARRAYIHRRSDEQPVAGLTGAEAVVLGMMDGRREVRELTAVLREALGERGPQLLDALVARLGPLLEDGRCGRTTHELAELAGVLDPDPREGLRRLPGPRVLHWHVTEYCPRRCAYCYADPRLGGRAIDAVLPRERLAEIFREARSLGAEFLLASGAEPLLRRDLPEILGDALDAGLGAFVTTKHPVAPALAERLAAARMPHLSLSLDSVDPDENVRLVGSRRYAEQVRWSARNLRRAGIEFSIQAVVSRLNPDAATAVAAFAAREGARVLQLVPFEPVRRPITALRNEDLRLRDDTFLDPLVEELGRAYPALRVERFREPAAGGGFHCDVGQTKLFFLPDGVVHRCYKLTSDDRLRSLDLTCVSVAAAWHHRAFLPVLSPPREAYAGTGCGSCARFAGCHDDGRCIYQALVRHDRYAAPDRDCDGPYAVAAGVTAS